MLEKIVAIREHKCFREFRWQDLPPFSRYNLIYGWNGSGKTTLSRLFSHFEEGTAPTQGRATFLVSGRQIRGEEIPGETLPTVRVFNREYVEKSVLSCQHNLKHILFLGEKAVTKQQERQEVVGKLSQIDEAIAQRDGPFRENANRFDRFKKDKAANIKQLLRGPGRNRYANYDKNSFEERCLALLSSGDESTPLDENRRDELLSTSRSDVRAKVTSPQKLGGLDSKLLPRLRDAFASSPVVRAIEKLKGDEDLSAWLATGLTLHKHRDAKLCLFCEKPISESRISELELHFSDSFRTFEIELKSLIQSIETVRARVTSIVLPDMGLFYPQMQERFRQATEGIKEAKRQVEQHLALVQTGLERRLKNPLVGLDAPKEIELLLSSVSTMDFALDELGVVIKEHNRVSENFETEVASAREGLEVDAIVSSIGEFEAFRQEGEKLHGELEKLREEKRELSERLAKLDAEIMETVRPAEELNYDLARYLGHSELQLSVSGTGYAITRAGEPAVDLSEGEKTAIALLYFLKTLADHRWPLSETIVVVDDPVSSLDAGAVFSAFGFIKERTHSAKQLFVLTHDFALFQLTKGWFKRAKDADGKPIGASMYLLKAHLVEGVKQSTLLKLDRLLCEFDTEYQYLFSLVRQAVTSDPQDLESFYGLPNVARRLLEHFLAFRFPGSHRNERLLGDLERLEIDSATVAVINRFLNIHSHGDGIAPPEHDLHLLSEAPRVLKAVLDVMRAEDPQHVARMEELCSMP